MAVTTSLSSEASISPLPSLSHIAKAFLISAIWNSDKVISYDQKQNQWTSDIFSRFFQLGISTWKFSCQPSPHSLLWQTRCYVITTIVKTFSSQVRSYCTVMNFTWKEVRCLSWTGSHTNLIISFVQFDSLLISRMEPVILSNKLLKSCHSSIVRTVIHSEIYPTLNELKRSSSERQTILEIQEFSYDGLAFSVFKPIVESRSRTRTF